VAYLELLLLRAHSARVEDELSDTRTEARKPRHTRCFGSTQADIQN